MSNVPAHRSPNGPVRLSLRSDVPAGVALNGGTDSRWILALMKPLDPSRALDAILSQCDKIGFQTPLARWIADSMEKEVRPLLLSKRCRELGIFDLQKVALVLTRQARGEIRAEYAIFRGLSAELWLGLFQDGEAVSPNAFVSERAHTVLR